MPRAPTAQAAAASGSPRQMQRAPEASASVASASAADGAPGDLETQISRAFVRDACAEAVRAELAAGVQAIRQVVREELDRDSDEEDGESEEESDESDGESEELKLVICVRDDLGMSAGKIAAQVGHAVHSAIVESKWRDLRAWEASGSKKVTLKVDSEDALLELQRQARKRGLIAESIQDAGHTEVEPGTTTVLAVGPGAAKAINAVTGSLRPLPDRVQQLERQNRTLRERAERLQQELDASKRKQKQLLDMMRSMRGHIM
eukprot:TRINITY_DN73979_c0_g1_i1.p2 TRINITY_DN73979_c0_g1~~TRINITY_DN73979_c0_g1_i1.p2  ORF type:complete len:262 (-),score=90.80 TRINITY_DN73979_c0_g1_i1:45-830(-)